MTDIQKIHSDLEQGAKFDKLNQLLNTPPKQEWVLDHPFAKGIKYISIQRIEMLLRTVFQKFEVKINSVQILANSVVVCVTLRVQDITTGEWWSQDGIGACAMQLDKGANATDFTMIKSNSVMIGAPAAESYAIKDAAEKFGKIFGSDLNRKDDIGFTAIYTEGGLPEGISLMVRDTILKCTDEIKLMDYAKQLTHLKDNEEFKSLILKQRDAIRNKS